jgi:hypothetical protein
VSPGIIRPALQTTRAGHVQPHKRRIARFPAS